MELNTGDLLLFRGNYILSRLIEYFTGGNYSHIGIVLNDPTYIEPKLIGLYMLESGEEDFKDSEDDKYKFGVQITDLKECLKNYKGEVYCRKLKCERDEIFYKKLVDINKKIHDKPYDLDLFDWIKADLGIYIGNVQKTNKFWCSALVAFVYVKLGFLSNDIPWTMIKPNDFSCKSDKLKFINCSLDDEKKLVL